MEEKTIFSKKLLYKQDDRVYSEHFETEVSAISNMYAFFWMIQGMKHPITTRARIGIIYNHKEDNLLLLNPTIEFWKNESWTFFDDILQNNKAWTPEKAEQEGLFMIESFLMGVSIDDVRDRYSDEIIEYTEEEDEEEAEKGENVLSFRPK
jgi:hypothetical protein